MIIITSDTILLQSDYKDEKESELASICLLQEEVQLEKGVTFGRIMELIYRDADFIEKAFHISLGGFKLQPFIDDMMCDSSIPDDSNNGDALEALVLSWVADDFRNELEIYTDLSGRAAEIKAPYYSEWYGVEFTPLSKLRDLPFELDTSFVIRNIEKKIEEEKVFCSTLKFTVYDLISGILNEITFCGYPENRDAKLCDILERKEEFLKDPDKSKLIKLSDLKKELGMDEDSDEKKD